MKCTIERPELVQSADTDQVPEDLALILNDSSLFSNSADITTKEILKRYGDRAKAPTINGATSSQPSNNGTTSPVPQPRATRVEADPHMQSAWQHEASVRHVGSDRDVNDHGAQTPPSLPYAGGGRASEDAGSSPHRGSIRAGAYEKQRAVGLA